ncbi:hypothetical protein IGI37_002584 [Enterococcus sp. AZ194]|uniref:response regulator transcription factor n=1 Tax=Enterococcus sp. AZ194 TaxID=2774629 RepID=UPI003F259668
MYLLKKKLLVIEDELDLATLIKKYLEREHCQVELCRNGHSAMSLFERFQPDFLLLDLMLPDRNGLDILQEIRKTSTIPVIIISAKETEVDRIVGLKLGADDYLTKPFSIKELIVRIETIFRRMETFTSNTSAQAVLKFHDYEINLLSREIKKDNTPIQLTTKEYDLFVFLLQHPRQVFSKAQLYEQVWGINEYGDMNTVTIHVQKIREKLGSLHEITTIRGIGYRFDGAVV